MKILVCGGRTLGEHIEGKPPEVADTERKLIWGYLDTVSPKPTVLIHGGARGADRMAALWAQKNDVPCTAFDADWTKNGRAAGPLRNRRMLVEGKPDLVIAFPGGRGTADMIRKAQTAGVSFHRVKWEGV